MQAISQSLTKLIDGRVQYVIPVFQRDYSWTEEQCAQLWKDVLEVAREALNKTGVVSWYETTGEL